MTDNAQPNLTLVMRNASPNRESRSSTEWVLDTRNGRSTKITIVFDVRNRPRILSWSAA